MRRISVGLVNGDLSFSCPVMQDPWRKRNQPKQGSPAHRRFLVEQPQARPTVFHETRDTAITWRAAQASANSEVFTKHETRDTKHGFFPKHGFSVAPMVLVGTEALQSCFFGRNVLWVDSDDAVAGTENLIHARRERAGWRRQNRPSHGFSGIYETRDPRHGVSLARGASRREFRGVHETRDPRHETRLFSGPNHGFSVASMVLVGTEALQSFFSIQACLA